LQHFLLNQKGMNKESSFLLKTYQYELPDELIAQEPVTPRDASRLMVLHRETGLIEHRHFRDLPEYVDEKDLFVANNTEVMKARLLGFRIREEKGKWVRGGKVEFLLLEEKKPLVWEGLFHAAAKHQAGLRFEIPSLKGEPLRGELISGSKDSPTGSVLARFDRSPLEGDVGLIPLPPYIRRDILRGETGWAHASTKQKEEDENLYQTVYAKEIGSAAAPTAGLHFTPQLLSRLKEKRCEWEEVTLHVGIGTFRPVKVQNIQEHVMHEERYHVGVNVSDHINQAKQDGKKIVAVGTTAVRTLESAWDPGSRKLQSGEGRTDIFIYPGKEFHVVDRMITNFHLPESTLLMLISAFAGTEFVREAYLKAVEEKYRFFSYGDAMLIL
jgi:S-adenosylmethionine:tRNA ribosyltransferase-isomerase